MDLKPSQEERRDQEVKLDRWVGNRFFSFSLVVGIYNIKDTRIKGSIEFRMSQGTLKILKSEYSSPE